LEFSAKVPVNRYHSEFGLSYTHKWSNTLSYSVTYGYVAGLKIKCMNEDIHDNLQLQALTRDTLKSQQIDEWMNEYIKHGVMYIFIHAFNL